MGDTSKPTFITYFIPGDGDLEEVPNVFLLRKPLSSVTLAAVTAAFPLPGEYQFRAKSAYGKSHGAWMATAGGGLLQGCSAAVRDCSKQACLDARGCIWFGVMLSLQSRGRLPVPHVALCEPNPTH